MTLLVDGGGLRYNDGKLARFDLMPPDAIMPMMGIAGEYAGDLDNSIDEAWLFWKGNNTCTVTQYPRMLLAALGAINEYCDVEKKTLAEALWALAEHYGRGAKKYADRNWERGMKWGNCFASAMRHATKFQMGEKIDEETGTHHLIATAWNFVALHVYDVRGIGEDDRMKLNTEKEAA